MPRYASAAVIGFAIVLPLLVWRIGPSSGALELLLCLVLGGSFFYAARDVRPGQSVALA